MKLKLPEQDGISKLSTVLQLICFLVLFLGIYLPLRQVVHAVILRILILLVDYFIVGMITFTVIRPIALKLEAMLRKKK